MPHRRDVCRSCRRAARPQTARRDRSRRAASRSGDGTTSAHVPVRHLTDQQLDRAVSSAAARQRPSECCRRATRIRDLGRSAGDVDLDLLARRGVEDARLVGVERLIHRPSGENAACSRLGAPDLTGPLRAAGSRCTPTRRHRPPGPPRRSHQLALDADEARAGCTRSRSPSPDIRGRRFAYGCSSDIGQVGRLVQCDDDDRDTSARRSAGRSPDAAPRALVEHDRSSRSSPVCSSQPANGVARCRLVR